MAFVAADPHRGLGTVVGNGHCMRHVQVVADVTHSSTLRRGVRVLDADEADIPAGVVIGTFDADGRYANATDGSSHVAILLTRMADRSLLVVDQWLGRPVGERVIIDKQGTGTPVNDASAFYIVEVA